MLLLCKETVQMHMPTVNSVLKPCLQNGSTCMYSNSIQKVVAMEGYTCIYSINTAMKTHVTVNSSTSTPSQYTVKPH